MTENKKSGKSWGRSLKSSPNRGIGRSKGKSWPFRCLVRSMPSSPPAPTLERVAEMTRKPARPTGGGFNWGWRGGGHCCSDLLSSGWLQGSGKCKTGGCKDGHMPYLLEGPWPCSLCKHLGNSSGAVCCLLLLSYGCSSAYKLSNNNVHHKQGYL